MIEVALTHRLGTLALDVAFAVPARGVTALFGRSGAGKTSVVNAVAGLLRPAQGRIVVGGTTYLDTARGIDLPPERRRVGYVFQDARLFPHLSVRANLLYGWRRAPGGDRPIRLEPVVEMLGIGHLLGRRPHGLSGGERQRVALGRALLAQPRILLMDEPLASLDAPRKAEILPFIENLRDTLRLPILYVSHAVEEVARLATTVVVLSDGRIAGTGAAADILSRLDLSPLTGRFEATSLLTARVRAHIDAFALTVLDHPAGELRLPRLDAAPGTAVRIGVRARDVSLALARPSGISMRNMLGTAARKVTGRATSSATAASVRYRRSSLVVAPAAIMCAS